MAIKESVDSNNVPFLYSTSQIYNPCAVAFIDILGFKEALKDESRAKDILNAFYELKDKVEELDSHYSMFAEAGFNGLGHTQITTFSDSIIISEQYFFVGLVIEDALKLSQLLLKKGFLCRGAIVCGELYHSNGIVFGNGLVDAWNNEKNLAKYPRIILDSQVIEWLDISASNDECFKELIKTDKDGTKFLNILFDNENLKTYLSDLVKNELQKGSKGKPISPSVKQKLIWLQNEYEL